MKWSGGPAQSDLHRFACDLSNTTGGGFIDSQLVIFELSSQHRGSTNAAFSHSMRAERATAVTAQGR